jgi:hypothetical protein
MESLFRGEKYDSLGEIVVLCLKIQQSRTESVFGVENYDGLERNVCVVLQNATVSHGVCVLSNKMRRSRTESLFCNGKRESLERNRCFLKLFLAPRVILRTSLNHQAGIRNKAITP